MSERSQERLPAGRRRSPLRLAGGSGVAWVLAGVLAGCAGSTDQVSGSAVFRTHCASCHSLAGTPDPRQQGGTLQRPRLSQRQLRQYAAEMPVVHGPLSRRELDAVVRYVYRVQRQHR